MRWAVAFSLVMFTNMLFAQRKIDSLIHTLDNTRQISQLNQRLFQLVDHGLLRELEPDRTRWPQLLNSIAEKTVNHASGLSKDHQTIVLAHLAEVLVREKTGGPGYQYIRRALDLSKSQSAPTVVFTYVKFADIFKALNRLDSATYYAEKALNVAYQTNSDSTVKESLNQLSGICYRSKNYSKADFYLRKLIVHPLIQVKERRSHLNTLGLTFRNRNMYDSARKYFLLSLEQSVLLKDTTWIGLTEGNIGFTWMLEGKHEKALPGLLKDLRFSLKSGNKQSAISALESIIEICMIQNKIKLAKEYHDSLAFFIRGESNEDVLLGYLKIKADYYEKINKPDSAYKYLKQYLKLSNDVSVKQYNLNAAQLEAQFQFDRQINHIEELERANLAQAQENKIKNYFLLLTAVIIVLSIILLYGQLRSNRFKNETNNILKKQNEKISLQAERLEELNATKDKLFAIIGHDLKGPINSLKTLMMLMKNQLISKEEFDTFFLKLQTSVDQVYLTLNNLLSWSKSQLQGMRVHAECVDLYLIVEENVDLLKEQAAAKQIELHNRIAANSKVWADPDHLRLVIRNLVSNGIKFTNGEGRVVVESLQQNGYCIISVCDTGVGMSDDSIRKLFQNSSSFTTSGTEGEKGTGLGLMLCKEVIEKNGGKIWVESKPGQGTSIRFSLPMEHIDLVE